MILLYHHLGLGDHIICNGLVREIHKKSGKLTLACKAHNFPSVKEMYSDLDIDFLIGNDSDIISKMNQFTKVIRIGFENVNLYSEIPVEAQFYDLAGIDRECKYTSSRFPISDKEIDVYASIFVHDDLERGMSINLTVENIIRPKQGNTLLSWVPIIKRCKEVHVIESSFMHLIECLPEKLDTKLFVHKIRNYFPAEKPILKNQNWNYV